MKSVLITGGTGDVGRSLVTEFANKSYSVWFQYSTQEDRADKLEKETGATKVQCDFTGDLKLPEEGFDILVNNAGVNFSDQAVAEIPEEDWRRCIEINLWAPIRLCRKLIPYMKAQGYGRIVNISSIYGLVGSETNGPYNVSKHALSGLTKSIAHDYGSSGITANEVCPGPIDSSLLRRIANQEGYLGSGKEREYYEMLSEDIPIGRIAYPKDISGAVLFLVSDEASYINGASIVLDGGQIA